MMELHSFGEGGVSFVIFGIFKFAVSLWNFRLPAIFVFKGVESGEKLARLSFFLFPFFLSR